MRGAWTAANGNLYCVYGEKFYFVSSAFAKTEYGSLSTSSGPVSISDNGTHVVIVDGQYGYTFNMETSVFAQITDPDFYPADQVTFLDGYFIFNRKNYPQFFISGLNDVTFDGADIGTAEGSPDKLIGLIATNQSLYLFGSKSIEVFYNSGDVDFPFSRIQGAVIDVGCSAAFSIVKLAGSTFWIGGDYSGSGIVYQMTGYQAKRISTPAIETMIRSLTSDQISAATAYSYQQGGHLFYCINIPGTDSTWCYDVSTGFWHERAYLNLWSLERHRAEFHTVAYGLNIVGDYANGNLYALDQSVYTDNGNSIARIRRSPHVSEGLKFLRHNEFQLDMETGVGTSGTGQGVDPKVMLRWSDDGGHSWSNEYWADAGKIGKTKTRVKWRRLGSSRDRVYEVKVTDPVKVVLLGVELSIEGGEA